MNEEEFDDSDILSRWGSRPAHVGMSLQIDVGESAGGERPVSRGS